MEIGWLPIGRGRESATDSDRRGRRAAVSGFAPVHLVDDHVDLVADGAKVHVGLLLGRGARAEDHVQDGRDRRVAARGARHVDGKRALAQATLDGRAVQRRATRPSRGRPRPAPGRWRSGRGRSGPVRRGWRPCGSGSRRARAACTPATARCGRPSDPSTPWRAVLARAARRGSPARAARRSTARSADGRVGWPAQSRGAASRRRFARGAVAIDRCCPRATASNRAWRGRGPAIGTMPANASPGGRVAPSLRALPSATSFSPPTSPPRCRSSTSVGIASWISFARSSRATPPRAAARPRKRFARARADRLVVGRADAQRGDGQVDARGAGQRAIQRRAVAVVGNRAVGDQDDQGPRPERVRLALDQRARLLQRVRQIGSVSKPVRDHLVFERLDRFARRRAAAAGTAAPRFARRTAR